MKKWQHRYLLTYLYIFPGILRFQCIMVVIVPLVCMSRGVKANTIRYRFLALQRSCFYYSQFAPNLITVLGVS